MPLPLIRTEDNWQCQPDCPCDRCFDITNNSQQILYQHEQFMINSSDTSQTQADNNILKLTLFDYEVYNKVIKSSDEFMKRTGDDLFVAFFENIVFNMNEGFLKGENLEFEYYCLTSDMEMLDPIISA
ncbi:35328_t:CDS:2 [Gigaspora margarita]|uniref:35328_t:CDS:1 n=1 Tax=Gigaspora margarita TaxID=4874 RepID=A0ABM8W3T9_GIGMA|nr:35328_t:CDS:2 [Gigaspora margarita]